MLFGPKLSTASSTTDRRDSALGGEMGHWTIVCLERHALDHQTRECDAHGPSAARSNEEFVVVPPPPAQTPALPIETQTRRQHDVDLGRIQLRRLGERLEETERVPLVGCLVEVHAERPFCRRPRHEEPMAVAELFGQRAQGDLAGKRDIRQDVRSLLAMKPAGQLPGDRDRFLPGASRLSLRPPAEQGLLRRHIGARGLASRTHTVDTTGPGDRSATVGWVWSPDVTVLSVVTRTFLTILSALVATPVASMAVWVVATIRPSSPLVQRIIEAWSRAWLVPAGVDISVIGSEHVDPNTSYVVVANHRSNIDIMVCFLALPVPIRFLAKAELFRVPVFAQAMRALGIVEVNRKHSRDLSIIESVNMQAQKVIERGHSLIIYPEGTRSRDGGPRPFKKGAFTMAVAAKMPVLPVTLHGTRRVWAPNRFWFHAGLVTVVIDPPIETAGLERNDVEPLRARVQDQINAHLDQLRTEPPDTSIR